MVFLSRFLSAEICKQSLMSLRKSTGHSFQHCKKALEQTNNNVNEAIKWLEKEAVQQGWSKLAKSDARATKDGVLAAFGVDNVAAIAEVQCETDFVARNGELREFARSLSKGLCKEFSASPPQGLKTITGNDMCQKVVDNRSVEEERARLIAKVGEKLTLSQCFVAAGGADEKITVVCHPDDSFGKYGAAITYTGGNETLAQQICRHIIGMKPTSVGTKDDLKHFLESSKKQASVKAETEKAASDDSQEDDDSLAESSETENDENSLILQDFVFDNSYRVHEILDKNDMQISKFWRFEVGLEAVQSN